MSLVGLLHRGCNKGKHAFWPPWHKTKRCLLCGCFSRVQAGSNTITIEDHLIKWSSSGAPSAVNQLGFNTSQNKPTVYFNSGIKNLRVGRGWEHVETKTIASTVSSTTFAGLTGTATTKYLIQGHIRNVRAAANGIYIRPNGVATNQRCGFIRYSDAVASQVTGGSAGLLVGYALAQYTVIQFEAVMCSARSVGGTNIYRAFWASSGGGYTAGPGDTGGSHSGGQWMTTAADITSMDVYCNIGIGQGSKYSLYRMDDGS